MGTFSHHEPCPACGSQDNLARYDDGSAYCFGCEHHEKAGGDVNEAATTNDAAPRRTDLVPGEYQALPKRGIDEDTCRKFGYRVGEHRGRKVQIADYRVGGKVVAQKIRDKSKDFRVLGDGKKLPMYGQWLWRSGGRRLTVCEGEIDALTVSMLQGNKWPVVSVPNGAQGAAKTVAREVEWLETFDKVVFAFDMDEPGQDAARECAALLSPGKGHVAHLPAKDPNEALLSGKKKELISSLWEAKPYQPEGVVSVGDLIERALAPIEMGRAWRYDILTQKTYGKRYGEVYGFGGGTGTGKSTVFKLEIQHILDTEPDSKVAAMFLEEDPALSLRTIGGMMVGARTHVPGVEFDHAELRRTLERYQDRLYLYDHFGGTTWETVKSKIRYYAHLGCKDIFLDHLTALAATVDDDERRALDKIMADMSALAKHLNICLYYISHLKRTGNGRKPHEEGGRVYESDFRGSGAIGFWTHFLFAIERDKQELEGVTTFRVLKDRYTGDANGLTFGLEYDTDTGRYLTCDLPDEAAEGWRPPKGGDDF